MIENNTAALDGGGVQIEGDTHMLMTANLSTIFLNHAGARGGGLQVVGPASADIGSPGYGGLGAISNNNAQEGGGVSVWVQGDGIATLNLFSTDAQRPLSIDHNFSCDRGGGIFGNAWTSTLDPIAYSESATISAFGVHVDGNEAPDGAAIWLDDSQNTFNLHDGASLTILKDALSVLDPSVAAVVVDCALDAPCNTIDGNRATDAAGNPTDGAVVHAQPSAEFFADQLAMRGNSGGWLLLTDFNNFGTLNTSLTNCLMADNSASKSLIVAHDLWLRNCTVANNSILGTDVLATDGSLLVHRVILWQPGTTASLGGGDFLDVISSDPQLVSKGPHVVVTDAPGFAGPDHGDYHLLPTSPAVDFTDCCTSIDLDGRNRGKTLYRAATRFDVGAYELQSVAPCFEPDKIFCNGFN